MKLLRRVTLVIVVTLLLAFGGLLAWLKLTRGSGQAYPDVSTAPLFAADQLEIVAELPLPPGNVAVSAEERIFFNYHYLGSDGDAAGHSVFEWVDGEPVPYPNADFQSEFETTLGMLIDRQNRLWIVDTAAIDGARNTRLFAFDVTTDELVVDYTFANNDADFAQDLQVTEDGNTLFLASTGLFRLLPANLIVLDLESGVARTVLSGHESVEPQNWRIHTQADEGVSVLWGLIDWQAGADGLALSPGDEWLYYAGINHDTMYRVRTADLLDATLGADELAARVEVVGQKPLSDGLSMDVEGNVYITDVENDGIARMTPTGELTTLVADERVTWADGISFGPDNYVYFSDSAIPKYLQNNLQTLPLEAHEALAPYYLFRFQNDIAGTPGA